MITPGHYNMKCIDIGPSETKGSEGNPPKKQIQAVMQFTEGEHAGSELPWYGFLTEKTIKSTKSALAALKYNGTLASCIGNVASCKVEMENDLEGIPRARVRFIGGGGVQITKLPPEVVASFESDLNAMLGVPQAPEAKKAFGFK